VCFRRVKPPGAAELYVLIYRISERVGRYLERAGLLVRDMENSYLPLNRATTRPCTICWATQLPQSRPS
jgi:hypothetical protein